MKYSYEEVIQIIQNTRRFGSLTGYEVSKRMLEQLGNPQCGIPFVHVAGTNGKGSTTAFLCITCIPIEHKNNPINNHITKPIKLGKWPNIVIFLSSFIQKATGLTLSNTKDNVPLSLSLIL